MAKFILGNRIIFDGVELKVGKEIDDAFHNTARLTASGARLIPIPNAPVEARAAQARREQARGQSSNINELTSADAESAASVVEGVISPTALAGAFNDYGPPDLASARIIRQDCSGSASLTGLVAPSPPSGRRITFINIATNPAITLTLAHENAGSVAANRFAATPISGNVVIPAGGAAEVWYDVVSARWRVVNAG